MHHDSLGAIEELEVMECVGIDVQSDLDWKLHECAMACHGREHRVEDV